MFSQHFKFEKSSVIIILWLRDIDYKEMALKRLGLFR